MPSATRPARPRRWSASARVTRSVTSRAMPAPGSNRDRRASPASTTTRTSWMVSEVSAIEVASTILRAARSGRIAACCACASSAPNSGRITQPGGTRSFNAASQRRISPSPGRNTSTAPSVSARARSTRSATACSIRAPRASGRSSQRVSTGNIRPWDVIRGASISAATGPASSVADIATSIRSSRSAPAISRHSASPKSAFSERSWNSSKITAPTPDSSGSDWIIRVRIPSVTTSIRVPGPTFDSPRMR